MATVSVLRQRSSYVLIVRPVGKFKPKKPSDRPERFEAIREDYRDCQAGDAVRRAETYNRTALLKGWKTWAVTGVDQKIATAHVKAAAAAKLTGAGLISPELDIDVWRMSNVLTGRFRLDGEFELGGTPKEMALAAIAAARQKLDAVEAHVKGLKTKDAA